ENKDSITGKKMNDLYVACTEIIIKPYNANIPHNDERHRVTISASVALRCKDLGNLEYAQIHIDGSTLSEAVDRLHHMVDGYRNLVRSLK
ncbi:MAG: hypothetical protein ACO35I_06160, partial [Burkholderiaceae bacterium]